MKNMRYKRNCNACGKYYEGSGRFYCSHSCAARMNTKSGFKKGNKCGSLRKISHKQTRETREKISVNNARYWLGKKRFNIGRNIIIKRGEKNGMWKGGITSKRMKDMNSMHYKKWRKQIFERDDYTCRNCDKRGCYLEAHHIKRWTDYSKLRHDIDNGITLCKDCHNKTKGKEKVCQSFRFVSVHTTNTN